MSQSLRKRLHHGKLAAIGWSIGLSSLLLVGASLTAASHPQQEAARPGETAGQKFKNIKVLKKLPADQLIPIMHKINTSLGVRCDYCHVEGNFASDEKPTKDRARAMIVMTEDLNKHYKTVDKKVNCYTCHHGNAEPEAAPSEGGK